MFLTRHQSEQVEHNYNIVSQYYLARVACDPQEGQKHFLKVEQDREKWSSPPRTRNKNVKKGLKNQIETWEDKKKG